MIYRISIVMTLFLSQLAGVYAQKLVPYKDSRLPIDIRVKDLLSRMTAEEKSWQLFMLPGDLDNASADQYKEGLFGFQVSAALKGDAGGQMLNYSNSENAFTLAKKINSIQKYFIEQTRLGIPMIAFDEALHGLVRRDGTVFPQAIGLAASWDTLLMHNVAEAIAEETRARGIRDILSPVINIASDVRWGRTEETYGEDPFLVSRMAVSFTGAFERKGIVTTPKHFIANVGDGGRDSYPIHDNERLLEEIYFPPFKACIKESGSKSVMTAYNTLDGTSCSTNSWLLEKKLKKQWGFTGFVISDANAVGGDVVLHYTAADYAAAGEQAINGGLDVIFQTEYRHHQLFAPGFFDGRINRQRLDDAVSRVLKAKFELGLFEHPYTSEEEAKKWISNDSHKNIARQAAFESFVLLKNEAHTLPIQSGIRRIALIGEEAAEARLGGYSGTPTSKISILQGLKDRAADSIEIIYEPGCGIHTAEWAVVPAAFLNTGANSQEAGLKAEYFNNIRLSGEPALVRNDKEINFNWTLSSPDKNINLDFYSIRWTGTLKSPGNGKYKIGLDGNDGYRLYINNELVIDNWQKQTYSTRLAEYDFKAETIYQIRVEFFEPVGNAHIKLIWNAGISDDWNEKINQAVKAAEKADIAVVTVGITEGEFQDRASLRLPGHQEELIQRVAATGKPVVVILVGGSAVTMNNWLNKAAAVLDVWYPGEEGGRSVAHTLFGDYNPAGRLPITFPMDEAQLPLVYNHKPTGRGDDYNNLSGLPLFPFGFGLSYTSFEYTNLQFSRNNIKKSDSTDVRFTLKNTGDREGDEVVQLYIRDLLSSVSRPVMELKGFKRVRLKPGESREISFTIKADQLSMLDKQLRTVVEPGDFRIMIGASSRDIRLKANLTVTD